MMLWINLSKNFVLLLFSAPATPVAEAIIDFHNDLMFYLIIVLGVVFWLLFKAITNNLLFRYEKYFFTCEDFSLGRVNNKFKHLHAFRIPAGAYFIIPSRQNMNMWLEIILTIIPTIILIFIAIPSFALLYSMDEVVDPKYTLRAIGNQWYWSYELAVAEQGQLDTSVFLKKFDSTMRLEEDLFIGELRLLEVSKKVQVPYRVSGRLLVTSNDVLHSWAVPSFGIKIDACPGRLNQVPLYPKRLGTYYGQCSEICGVNHGFMPIAVKVVTMDNFFDWYLKYYTEIKLQSKPRARAIIRVSDYYANFTKPHPKAVIKSIDI